LPLTQPSLRGVPPPSNPVYPRDNVPPFDNPSPPIRAANALACQCVLLQYVTIWACLLGGTCCKFFHAFGRNVHRAGYVGFTIALGRKSFHRSNLLLVELGLQVLGRDCAFHFL
jgi:hypothetical protein